MSLKDFGEPWSQHPVFKDLYNSDGKLIVYEEGMLDVIGQRIVDCVNGCAGMDDPANEVTALWIKLAEAEATIEKLKAERGIQ